MNTERKPLTNESYSVKCPYCNKDLPVEIDFCPYCMERLSPAKNISPPNTPKQKNKKFVTVAILLMIVVVSLGITVFLSKNKADKNEALPQTDKAHTNQAITPTSKTTASETQIRETDTTNKPVASDTNATDTTEGKAVTKTDKSTSQSSDAPPKTVEADIINRWNSANNSLYIYNFVLDNYTFRQEKEQFCVSQRFNNSGAIINFNVKNDLEEYTLDIDNIENLSIMNQLCRISFATIAGNQYSDTEFYNFISDDSWEQPSENQEVKSGVFGGYNCSVVLTEITEPGAGGLDYKCYTCSLTVKKS